MIPIKVSVLVAGLAAVPSTLAWGSFGHMTVAYLASDFVSRPTEAYFQALLRNDTADYLAGVATWADSIRYTKWGRFTAPFHFIDAKDAPPASCSVDLARDCKPQGCVVTALHNYTTQLLLGRPPDHLDPSSPPPPPPPLPAWRRAQAAKFVVHFVGDAHQPLHDEDVARGGNGINVTFGGVDLNLHHVWDTSIPERMVGGVRRRPFAEARAWASGLAREIRAGKFRHASRAWLDGMDLEDPTGTALRWAREGNEFVCSTVLPKGPEAIRGQELGSDYYEKAAPVVELQIARAGYRLAHWLDLIAANITTPRRESREDL